MLSKDSALLVKRITRKSYPLRVTSWMYANGRGATRGAVGGFMFEGLMQPMHLLVILFIALLVFGPSKLSDLGKGLGQGIKNFKDAVNDKGAQPPTPAAPPADPAKKDNAPTA